MTNMLRTQEIAYNDILEFRDILLTRLNIGLVQTSPIDMMFEFYSNMGNYYRGFITFLDNKIFKIKVLNQMGGVEIVKSVVPGQLAKDASLLKNIAARLQK